MDTMAMHCKHCNAFSYETNNNKADDVGAMEIMILFFMLQMNFIYSNSICLH